MSKKPISSKVKTILFQWAKIIKEQDYPDAINKNVYRLANIDVSNINKKEDIFKIKKIKIGPKDILSFTKDKDFAYTFYKKFYKDLTKRKDKRFAYVVVSTKCIESNYVFDIDSLIGFMEYLLKNIDIINNVKEYKIKYADQIKMTLFSIKNVIKLLNSKFYQEQQEVGINCPNGECNVIIEDIIYSNKFNIQ